MRYTDVYNTVNIVRNGGLDFLKSSAEVPPFWKMQGAQINAAPPVNSFSVVTDHVPEAENGAARYFKFVLSSASPVVLQQEFLDIFPQMTFCRMGDYPWRVDHDRLRDDQYPAYENVLIRGIEVTVAVSIRVVKGSAKISLSNIFKNANGEDIQVYAALASRDWVRPSTIVDLGGRMLKTLGIKMERIGTGDVAEVHIGAITMITGATSDAPYVGDPMADAIPKGAIIFMFGDTCPPGFELMNFEAPRKHGRIFPRNGPPSLDIGGAETHVHTTAEMVMSPEEGWDTFDMVPTPFDQNEGTPADSSMDAHTHAMGSGDHVPPSKDVILCKRL